MAVRDFKRPLIAGTSTTIVVFIPMMVLPGVTGKFLAYIPITVFSTLIAALFIALTINSALFFKLSKKKKSYLKSESIEKFLTAADRAVLEDERKGKIAKEEESLSKRERILEGLNSGYERILRKFISKRRNRWLSILVPIVALFLTFIFLSPRIGFTLFPDGDNARFDMVIEDKV
jgi:multidrug efflux pump subunit AcrB